MTLIDSLYINESGGLQLLKYLVESIESDASLNAYYLFDKRCADCFIDISANRKTVLNASLWNRLFFYKKNKSKFSKVLCFGNIPPPIFLNAKIFTYFHNINLLRIPKSFTIKERVVSKIKRNIICHLKDNTDYWLVQTENTKNELKIKFIEADAKIQVLPFFKIEDIIIKPVTERNDYIFVANYVKEKNHLALINAWCNLFDLGYYPTLHLTLSDMPEQLEMALSNSINKGVNIVNHGFVNKSNLGDLYSLSKATIYPSINESLGLGIVEALQAGCDLIGPDLPYIHSISQPSVVFNPYYVNSIVEAVIQYETRKYPKSKLKIHNELNELMLLLS